MDHPDAVLEVRLWNAALTGWIVLPLSERGLPGVAPGVEARITAEEGYGDLTLPLYGVKSDFTPYGLVKRRRVELWAVWKSGGYGEALLYRGQIQRIDPQVKDRKRLIEVKAYGRFADVARAAAKKKYVKVGTGVDRSEIFGDLMARFVLPPVGGGPPRIGGATIIYTTTTTGDMVNRLDAKRVGTALETLAKGGKRIAKGCDVESGSGDDRVYFRPFANPETDTPTHVLHVPGPNIGTRDREVDTSRQITELQLYGGTLPYANLLAAYTNDNTDFESPREPTEQDANILLNPGFENVSFLFAPDDWTGSLVATGAAARSGSYGLQIGGATTATQTQNPIVTGKPIRPGDTYCVGGWARIIDAAHPASWLGLLSWLDSGGSTLSTFNFGPGGAGLGPLQVPWRRYDDFSIPPPGTTGYSLLVQSSNANDIRIDDLFLYNASLLLPDGWRVGTTGSGTVIYNGAYEGDSWEGGYSLYLHAGGSPGGYSSGDRVYVAPGLDQVIPLTVGEEYVFCCRYAAPNGSAPDLQVLYQGYDGGGSPTISSGSNNTGGTFTGWKYAEARFTWGGAFGGVGVRLFFDLIGNGDILIDAVMFVVATALPPVDSGTMQTAFWPVGSYQRLFRADELYTSGPIYDAAIDIQGGAGLPGPYDEETRQEIIDDIGGETYAKAVFAERTPELDRPNLETFGIVDTGFGGDTASLWPGDLMQLVGQDAPDLMPENLPCAEKLIRWDKGMLSITPYPQSSPPDAARTLTLILRDELRRFGIVPQS